MDERRGWSGECRISYLFLLLYLYLLIFCPYLRVAGRENFEITFVINSLFVLMLPAAFKRMFRGSGTLDRIALLLAAVLVFDCLSIVNYMIAYKGAPNIIANIIPNLKAGLYLLLALSFYPLRLDDDSYRRFLHTGMPSIALCASLIGIFQWFNILDFDSWFTRYYIPSQSGKLLFEDLMDPKPWTRVLGTLSNPNFYAIELIFFMVYIISNVIFDGSRKGKTADFVILLLIFAGIIFSQSRTAIVVLVCLTVYIAALQIARKGVRSALPYAAAIAAVILVPLVLMKFMDLSYLMNAVKSGTLTGSFVKRLDRWKDALKLFRLHPIIGIGPVVQTYFASVDSEYIHILRNYGALGLLAHLCFYIYVFVASLRDFFSNKSGMIRQYGFIANCTVLSVLVAGITQPTFYHWRNFILLLVTCCIWAKIRDEQRDKL